MSKYGIYIYWSEADSRFIAEAPELPGCMADGASYAEATRNIETVIEHWIDTARLLDREIPAPKGNMQRSASAQSALVLPYQTTRSNV